MRRIHTDDLIRGDNFKKLADHKLLEFDELTFNPDDIKDGDIVFSTSTTLNKWKDVVLQHKDLVIITHNSDGPLISGKAKEWHDLNIDDFDGCFKYWFAENCCVNRDNVFPIPIGFMNEPINKITYKSRLMNLSDLSITPTKLMYANFKIKNNVEERQKCLDICELITDVDVQIPHIDLPSYFNEIQSHKYIISPPGHGLDCYRTWETMFFGRVPILIRSPLDAIYKDMPVLIIDDWRELDDLPLDDMYEDILSKTNREMLTQKYWNKYIMNIINK
jgi:hypothetical protein